MPSHPVSPKVYYSVFGALLVLTGLTISVSFLDLGRFNAVVALTIAVAKALLVVLYFMHVRYSTRLTQLVIGGGLLWLGILIAFTMGDYLTRGRLIPTWGASPLLPRWEGWEVRETGPQPAPGPQQDEHS